MSSWTSMSEEIPKHGSPVLLIRRITGMIMTLYTTKLDVFQDKGSYLLFGLFNAGVISCLAMY